MHAQHPQHHVNAAPAKRGMNPSAVVAIVVITFALLGVLMALAAASVGTYLAVARHHGSRSVATPATATATAR